MTPVSEQLAEIARRKERLMARSEAQRAAIGASLRQLQGPIRIVDRGLDAARFLRAHPLLVVVAVATLVVFRGRGLLSLARRAFSVWRLWRSLSAWAARLS